MPQSPIVYNDPSTLTPTPIPIPTPTANANAALIQQFTNARLLQHHQIVKEDLWVKGEKIIDPRPRFWEASARHEFAAHHVIDCKGYILAPGYIDIQINGAFGIDFSTPTDLFGPNFEVEIAEIKRIDQGPNCTAEDALVKKKIISAWKQNAIGALQQVSNGLVRYGVTSYLPTLITSSPETYRIILEHFPSDDDIQVPLNENSSSISTNDQSRQINNVSTLRIGAHALGLHLEGPFLVIPGAHPTHLLQNTKLITPKDFIVTYGNNWKEKARIVTVAPEIPGMVNTIRELTSTNSTDTQTNQATEPFVMSLGHSSATYDCAISGLTSGATLLTHLFNAMVPFHHRDPGIIGVLGCNNLELLQRTYYSCIVDGIHTHPASVKMAYHSHPEGIILVTDAMCAMGLQEGHYSLGQMSVMIESVDAHNAASQKLDANGKAMRDNQQNAVFSSQKGAKRAVLEGTNTLAGSIATLNECVQNFHQFTSCSLVEAIEAATLHPAEVLGITQTKGTLSYGADADLILLDDALNVKATWIKGKLIWHDEKFIPQIQQNV